MLETTEAIKQTGGIGAWWRSLEQYRDRRVLLILPLGFASGLPLLLTFSTLSAWFATAGVSRATIGAFALVGTPYAFKFLWSPLIDRLPPPIPLGRRRGWGIAIQIALIAATLALGSCDPKLDLARMGALALLVAFLSASQDVVIDAYRVEILAADQQGPGAAMIQTGYRIAMLVSGAGALIIAARFGWFAAYATMAALLASGCWCSSSAPSRRRRRASYPGREGWSAPQWLATAVIATVRRLHAATTMARDPHFHCRLQAGRGDGGSDGDAAVRLARFLTRRDRGVSKLVGFFATVAGALIGGVVTVGWA